MHWGVAGRVFGTSLLLAVGCTSTRDCTLVGFESEVSVSSPDSVEVIEFCLDGECVPRGAETTLQVDDRPATYDYRIVVADIDGVERVIEGTVSTEEHFANGKGCDPRTANATLMVDAAGGVEISHP